MTLEWWCCLKYLMTKFKLLVLLKARCISKIIHYNNCTFCMQNYESWYCTLAGLSYLLLSLPRCFPCLWQTKKVEEPARPVIKCRTCLRASIHNPICLQNVYPSLAPHRKADLSTQVSSATITWLQPWLLPGARNSTVFWVAATWQQF